MAFGSLSGSMFGGSEVNFGHAAPTIGEGNVSVSNSTGEAHPHYQGPRSVLSYRNDTNSSFGRSTAWSVPRGQGTPMSYSSKTAGSVFNFD
jgi:hypothetical protein